MDAPAFSRMLRKTLRFAYMYGGQGLPRNLCVNCTLPEEDHANNGKCLYEPGCCYQPAWETIVDDPLYFRLAARELSEPEEDKTLDEARRRGSKQALQRATMLQKLRGRKVSV